MTDPQDRQDICDTLIRYATGIDRRDWELFRTVFTDDCACDYGEIGRWRGVDEVTEFMATSHAAAGHTLHRMTNQVIDVEGGRATARTYVDAYILAPDSTAGVNAVGIYDDELVRTAGGWRVASRRFTPVRVTAVP
ncbi:nuclear transport factor 2 family protein [Mycobacterium sp. MYCO198283]|uniref:nuclear transport factor 2 family protein n=1 Tax=Mycobacterium sp. MYCO198283 TaxID=2883505 RepID=UPI001E38FA62|nr:nuclear transport factor 2 family protein [Mycobacterium sp. MYCO198283]MCG5434003.1 nuclear transport factor 2 family protein [Mycobacterium sp. MYCO198283]